MADKHGGDTAGGLHAINIWGVVDMSLHAFEGGQRRHIEHDEENDVFSIEGTEVTLVALRD